MVGSDTSEEPSFEQILARLSQVVDRLDAGNGLRFRASNQNIDIRIGLDMLKRLAPVDKRARFMIARGEHPRDRFQDQPARINDYDTHDANHFSS